jgi:RimJ/RimL family protein N-acetyltransferase
MLRGEIAGLRARHESDIPVLQAELHDDVLTRIRADSRPWRPIPPGSPSSPYAVTGLADDVAVFSVIRLPDEELAGEALLWGIDTHNRTAHIGISLRPAFRGGGLGTDTVQLLCYYGFTVLGLHRLQIETLADNASMIAVARRVGFAHEGTLRHSAWAEGTFADEAILGMLTSEWSQQRP